MKAQEANDLMTRMQLARSPHVTENLFTKLIIIIPGTPIPKQSVRMGRHGAFQPTELVYAKKKIKSDIQVQLPKGFLPWEGPVQINRICFVYEYLKGHSKKEKEQYNTTGKVLYKVSRPDFDNLCKLPLDCMTDIIYKDDSQICYLGRMEKYFGVEAFTLIELEKMEL